ncbi:MAG: HAD family hydrolase [Anaerolineales bacterium]
MLPPIPTSIQRIVIFDFDGVITDTMAEMLRFSDQVCTELSYPRKTSPEDILALPRMGFDHLARQLGIAEPLVPKYVQLMLQRFVDSPITYAMVEGMEEVIRDLAVDSLLAVVSGNMKEVIQRFLRKYQLDAYFWQIMGIDQPGNKVEKIIQIRQEVSPSLPAFMIGDAVSDIQAAKEAGAISIAVTWGHQARQKLIQAHPQYLVEKPLDLIATIRAHSSSRTT